MNRQHLENVIKDTMGYMEAENKKSFMTGVSVALMKVEESYEQELNNLRSSSESWKSAYENLEKEIKSIASILNRYREDDF